MSKKIKLAKGKVAIVDDEDYEWLSERKWRVVRDRYAGRNYWDKIAKRSFMVYMHRAIMRPSDEMVVDHINGDGFDNRRDNLRICTQGQNSRNQKTKKKWKGVYKRSGRWYAVIMGNGEIHRSKGFPTKKDAARAYDKMAIDIHDEYANLNFKNSRSYDWTKFEENSQTERKKHKLRKTLKADHSKRRKSKYRGVFSGGNAGGWIVRVRSGGKSHYGGHFKCEKKAARCYNNLAEKLHGDIAVLNNIKDEPQ